MTRAPKVRRVWKPQEWLTKARREKWHARAPNSLERQAWEMIKRQARPRSVEKIDDERWVSRVGKGKP